MTPLRFEYILQFEDGSDRSFALDIDPDTFLIIDDSVKQAPAWTDLEFEKCTHCPYKTGELKHCPVAKNLAFISEACKDDRSFEKVTVFVKTDERTYGKRTDLQTALFSIFGLVMASSACVHLQLFKSMARFHLPFSTADETKIRVLGFYLIQEFLKQSEDPKHKIDLAGLAEKYQNVALVNQGIIKRIRAIKGGDANKNAVVILDAFASLLPMELGEGLSDVKAYFR